MAIRQQLNLDHLKRYEVAHDYLRREVSTINMLQYYRLTNQIELSCTSVDLDDKVLRFFNHLTTPRLPVARAVQMSGSFPIGFKSVKWRK